MEFSLTILEMQVWEVHTFAHMRGSIMSTVTLSHAFLHALQKPLLLSHIGGYDGTGHTWRETDGRMRMLHTPAHVAGRTGLKGMIPRT